MGILLPDELILTGICTRRLHLYSRKKRAFVASSGKNLHPSIIYNSKNGRKGAKIEKFLQKNEFFLPYDI